MYRRTYKKAADPVREQQQDKQQRMFPTMTMTVDEMAEELNISRPTAYELVKDTDFPSFRLGKRILINRAGLQRWIDRLSEPPLTDPASDAA